MFTSLFLDIFYQPKSISKIVNGKKFLFYEIYVCISLIIKVIRKCYISELTEKFLECTNRTVIRLPFKKVSIFSIKQNTN